MNESAFQTTPRILDYTLSGQQELISTLLVEKIYKIIITIVGLIGNILTIILLSRKRNRKSSTAVYLSALAMSDILILVFGPLCDWLEVMYHVVIWEYGEVACKLQTFLQYASSSTSSWLLVVVTIERAISVTFPHKVKSQCTKRLAIIVVAITWALVYAANLHFLFGMGHTYNKMCDAISDNYIYFSQYILPWIDFCLCFACPCVLLLIGNAVIIRQLGIHHHRHQYLTNSHRPNNLSVSLILVLVDLVFIITVGPIYIFSIVFPYMQASLEPETIVTVARFWGPMLNCLWETNAALNIFLYVISGTKFRNELKTLLCFCCHKAEARTHGVFESSLNFHRIYVRSSINRRTCEGNLSMKGSEQSMELLARPVSPTHTQHDINEPIFIIN